MPHATDKPAAAATEGPPPGQVDLAGERYWIRADGARIPDRSVKTADKLVDAAVRGKVARALEVNAILATFRAEALQEFDELLEVLASQYDTPMGGRKGNVTWESVDGTLKVVVAVADRIVFGPELQIASAILDKLLTEWGKGTKAELQAIIQDAFRVDKEGQVNRSALLGLLRIESEDERWGKAMQAIKDSMRVEGSKRYIRFYNRANAEASWTAIRTSLSDA